MASLVYYLIEHNNRFIPRPVWAGNNNNNNKNTCHTDF